MGLWMAALLLLTILMRDKESWLYRSKFGLPVVVVAVAALLPESAALTVTRTNIPSVHLSAFIALRIDRLCADQSKQNGIEPAREKAARIYCGVALLLAAFTLGGTAFARARNAISTSRSFYGVLSVGRRTWTILPEQPTAWRTAACCMDSSCARSRTGIRRRLTMAPQAVWASPSPRRGGSRAHPGKSPDRRRRAGHRHDCCIRQAGRHFSFL